MIPRDYVFVHYVNMDTFEHCRVVVGVLHPPSRFLDHGGAEDLAVSAIAHDQKINRSKIHVLESKILGYGVQFIDI